MSSFSDPPPSAQQLLYLAQGRWVEILSAAGIPAQRLDGRGHPCPRCGGRDRFNAFADLHHRGAVHCRHCFNRGTDPRPGNGISTLMWISRTRFRDTLRWLADYLAVGFGRSYSGTLVPVHASTSNESPRRSSAAEIQRMTRLTADSMRRISDVQLCDLAAVLGVTVSSLRALCVGYSTDQQATTWPMRNSDGQIIGIRFRADGANKKWSLRGSCSGLFLSRDHRVTGDHLFIVEGASDLAAGLDLGLPCIGRADCGSGTHRVAAYLRRCHVTQATVIADRDDAGIGGAIRLAKNLAIRGVASRVVTVPDGINDLRDWCQRGATAAQVISLEALKHFDARIVSQQMMFEFAA